MFLLQLETGRGSSFVETNEGFYTTFELAKEGGAILTGEEIVWSELVHNSRWSACLCELSPDCPTLKIRKVQVDRDATLDRDYFIWQHEDLVEERLKYPTPSKWAGVPTRTPSNTIVANREATAPAPPTTPVTLAPTVAPTVAATTPAPAPKRGPVEIGGAPNRLLILV